MNVPFGLVRLRGFHRKSRLGASAVEFAVVAPVFFLLVFGIIEYGRMVMVQQVLTNAAREGARSAVVAGATPLSVTTTVEKYLTSASISGAKVVLDPSSPKDAASGDPISVTITISFSDVSWLPAPMYLGNTDLTAQSVMRKEIVPATGS